MLTQEQNAYLTQTSAGTPMGNLFRCYWQPALLATELPSDDSPPVRLKLLNEPLVAIRDSNGRYGLISEFCAHRGASLWFGHTADGGIRCAYHGWKYDVTGQCTEVPSEPAENGFCANIKLRSYPLVKRGEILWTYMGPRERTPPLPEWEFAMVPPEQSYTSKRLQCSNWLQGLEGGIDSSHVSWLHRSSLESDPLFKGARGNKYNLQDPRPVFEVMQHAGGLIVAARRNAENDSYYWRLTPWVMPNFTTVPPRGSHPVHGHFWVPIDDGHCWVWSFDYHPTRALTEAERDAMRAGKGIHVATIPGTYLPRANMENNYNMDRETQRRGESMSGIAGIGMQDAALQESMGPVADRTTEHLVSTDNGIIMARQRLLRAARALLENGTLPPGLDPAHQRVRSAAIILKRGEDLRAAAAEALLVRASEPHASV